MVFRKIEFPVPAVSGDLAYAVAAFQHVSPELVLVKCFGGYYPETYYRYFFIVHKLFASIVLNASGRRPYYRRRLPEVMKTWKWY